MGDLKFVILFSILTSPGVANVPIKRLPRSFVQTKYQKPVTVISDDCGGGKYDPQREFKKLNMMINAKYFDSDPNMELP